jgi:hypothetical protein
MAGVKVFWTVLPNGKTSDGKVKVSVAISFQLWGAANLKDYPKIEQWPATMAKLIAKVRLDFGTALATVVRDPDSSPVDPQLWTQLFPGSTPVGATTQLNGGCPIRTALLPNHAGAQPPERPLSQDRRGGVQEQDRRRLGGTGRAIGRRSAAEPGPRSTRLADAEPAESAR